MRTFLITITDRHGKVMRRIVAQVLRRAQAIEIARGEMIVNIFASRFLVEEI